MSSIADAMRRVITGDDMAGKSCVILNAGPSCQVGSADMAGLFEVWEDAASGPLRAKDHTDLGPTRPILGAKPGDFQVRWFVINPAPEGIAHVDMAKAARETFAQFEGEHHITDQSRHPGMHRTQSIDIVCLIQGEASLILDGDETRLKPGNIVIQRGTSHAWVAHGGPAFFMGVVIARELDRA